MPIRIRLSVLMPRPNPDHTPSLTHILGNLNFLFTFFHCNASLHCYICFKSVIGFIIFSILDSIWKFSGKSIVFLYICLKWMYFRIWIGRSWIPIRIWQNDADPTGSGSTTNCLYLIVFLSASVADPDPGSGAFLNPWIRDPA